MKESALRDSLPRFVFVLALVTACLSAPAAGAAPRDPWAIDWLVTNSESGLRASSAWQVSFSAVEAAHRSADEVRPALFMATAQEATRTRPHAIEYSHGYEVRRKIHVYASFATLPLFATEIYLGEKLYSGNYDPFGSTRGAHQFVASSIAVLFGVNTVTGIWNLKEGWKNPEHRSLRLAHGLLMLGADAGFVATGMLAPNKEGEGGNRSAHRAVAYTSMGVATVSYLMMLFGR